MNALRKRNFLITIFAFALGVTAVFAVFRKQSVNGQVASYLLDERGGVNGLFLTNGTQLHFSSEMGEAVSARVRIGAVVLFHSANAAMLPLVGEALGGDANQSSALYLSACIIVAQSTMIPVALAVGKYADTIGHKPIFLVGIASIVVRGALFATSKNPYFLVSVQVLDGVGAAIFGVLNVLIIASLTRGTGRFNFAQGAVATSVGIGGGLSNLGAGFLVKHSGFKIGFLALSIVAAIAFVFFALLMPETKEGKQQGLTRHR